MDKKLTGFIKENPDYFESLDKALVLRGDIRHLFEEYAQAFDPSEYAELKQKMKAFREKEKARLQHEVDQLIYERKEEEERFREISREIEKYEKEVARLEGRLSVLLQNEDPEKNANAQPKSWYNSGYTFLLLDFLGVVFLYLGLILNERLTMSYVALGVCSIAAGFLLQQGSGRRKTTSPDMSQTQGDTAIFHQQNDFRKLTQIKQMTLNSQKRVASARISELNRKLDTTLAKINEHLKE